MSSMPHDFDPAHPHSALPPDPVLRVQVLETILTQKGLVDPDTLAAIIATYENLHWAAKRRPLGSQSLV